MSAAGSQDMQEVEGERKVPGDWGTEAAIMANTSSFPIAVEYWC